jgi:hypothetical protein
VPEPKIFAKKNKKFTIISNEASKKGKKWTNEKHYYLKSKSAY